MPAFRFQPRVHELDRGLDAATCFARLAHRRAAFLDSASGWPREVSLVAFDPLPVRPPARFEELEDWIASLEPADGDPVPGPFHGGFVGSLAYDLGVPGEEQELPLDPWHPPLVAGGLFTDFVVFLHAEERAFLVLGDEPGDGRADVATRRRALLEELAAPREPRATGVAGPLVRHVAPDEHRRRIELARAAIARGDYYQANLAHRFTREVVGDPVDLYLALRAANPAPYAAFVPFEGGALLSSSPELLLELRTTDGGRRTARTRPIKGTVARDADPELDAVRRRELVASRKDRAELAMIVDLERNDLGRTARAGTVRVEDFPALRSYARVHHLTADVVAEPRAGVSTLGVVAALFPGGSITGAPKLASMGAIAELEGEGRGHFCGSMGFVDLRGEARLNVAIRTATWRPRPEAAEGRGEVSFRVGGGITFRSDARAEDDETLAKASALVAAFEGSTAEPSLEVSR